MQQLGYPAMNIWGMYPVTNWIVETRPEHMFADGIIYGSFSRMGGTFLSQVPLTNGPITYTPSLHKPRRRT